MLNMNVTITNRPVSTKTKGKNSVGRFGHPRGPFWM